MEKSAIAEHDWNMNHCIDCDNLKVVDKDKTTSPEKSEKHDTSDNMETL